MTLAEKLRKLNDEGWYQRVIDKVEALDENERTPEVDMEMVSALNNLAEPDDTEMIRKSFDLLIRHQDYFKDDKDWNFRMGFALCYMDREGRALPFLRKAMELATEDKEDIGDAIGSCMRTISMPSDRKPFIETVVSVWQDFEKHEARLRELLSGDVVGNKASHGDLAEMIEEIFAPVFAENIFLRSGVDGKCNLYLSAGGRRDILFVRKYLKDHVPESVLKNWNVHVGRPAEDGMKLMVEGVQIEASDVQVSIEPDGKLFNLTIYCEKMAGIDELDDDDYQNLLSTYMESTLGELNCFAWLYHVNCTREPLSGYSVSLNAVSDTIIGMGGTEYADADEYLENCYSVYKADPEKDPEAPWRLDTMIGMSRLGVLMSCYMHNDVTLVENLRLAGITAGFICIRLPEAQRSGADDEEQKDADFRRVLKLRESFEKTLGELADEHVLTITGHAIGLYWLYIDFLAWNSDVAMEAFHDCAVILGLETVLVKTWYGDSQAIRVWEEGDKPEVDPKTGSLLSEDDIELLHSFYDDSSGYFAKAAAWIQDFVKNGVDEERFTDEQAKRDLTLALEFSYALNNLDSYEAYCSVAKWMPFSRCNASGCGTWFYRYSVALMFKGQLEKALEIAEEGTAEEPDYPWIWLQVGKLRAHFGKKDEALEAVERGLQLVPGDREFTDLRREIEQGSSIEKMEFHWINSEQDSQLQSMDEKDREFIDKKRSISCISTDEQGMKRFWEIMGARPAGWRFDGRDWVMPWTSGDLRFEILWRMSEGALSHLDERWLRNFKDSLDKGTWNVYEHPENGSLNLSIMLVRIDGSMRLAYLSEDREKSGGFDVRPDGSIDEDTYWQPGENSDEQDGTVPVPVVYDTDQMKILEAHIDKYFGDSSNVFHEIFSPDIHVDLYIVEPTPERNFYTIVTMGMGARPMDVPEELAEHKLERAELVICLPPDWKVENEDMQNERWYWPFRLLKVLARMPVTCDTWLGWGHTIDNQEPYCKQTKLSAAILTGVVCAADGAHLCKLSDTEEVNFYQVMPLYADEMEYKVNNDAEALLERMADVDFIVDMDRPSVIGGEKKKSRRGRRGPSYRS